MSKIDKILYGIVFLLFASTVLVLVDIGIQAKNKLKLTSKDKMFNKPGNSALLLKVNGEIHSGRSTVQSTGADSILAELRSIEDREEVKGILIEVDSPGGTVGASQEIYDELMYLRNEKGKKIVISMKDLAASGGYYIASASDFIYTQAGTITGSIGVITMSPNISGLLKKYSVEMRVYKAGKYKDILSMFKTATKEEDEIIRKLLSDTYNRFIKDVSLGRKMDLSLISKLAEGKIYSGEEAVKVKLADGIGGRREAHKKLNELVGEDLELIQSEENPFDRFFEILGVKTNRLSISPVFKDIKQFPVLVILPSAISIPLLPENL
jgi:protease-4